MLRPPRPYDLQILELYYPFLLERMDHCERYDEFMLLITDNKGKRYLMDEDGYQPSLQKLSYFHATDLEKDDYKKEFGKLLYRRIWYSGMTEEIFAEKLGLSQPAVAKYTTGASLPSVFLIPRMADILECTTDDLINWF